MVVSAFCYCNAVTDTVSALRCSFTSDDVPGVVAGLFLTSDGVPGVVAGLVLTSDGVPGVAAGLVLTSDSVPGVVAGLVLAEDLEDLHHQVPRLVIY